MTKPTEFELGYTPKNLRIVRTQNGLTQHEVAEITGASNYRTVARWETPPGTVQRADMPYKKWVLLLKYLEQRQNDESC